MGQGSVWRMGCFFATYHHFQLYKIIQLVETISNIFGLFNIQLLSNNMSKEDLSTAIQPNPQLISEVNYVECIQELTSQNRFKKQALITADNLIDSYRNENQLLKKQNQKLFFQVQKYKKEIKQLKEELQRQREDKDRNIQMSARFQLLADRQEKYEQKIRNMQNKIFILERQNKNNNNLKSKLPLKTQCIEEHFYDKNGEFLLNQSKKQKNNYKNLAELRNMYVHKEKQTESVKRTRIQTENRLDSFRAVHEKHKDTTYSTPKKRNKPSRVSWK